MGKVYRMTVLGLATAVALSACGGEKHEGEHMMDNGSMMTNEQMSEMHSDGTDGMDGMSQQEMGHEVQSEEHQAMEQHAPSAPHGTKVMMEEPLKSVYENYLGIQVALGNDSLKGVAELAKKIATAVAEDKTSVLPAAAGAAANQIAAAADLDGARKAFSGLSASLLALVEAKGVQNSGLVLVYCPMAKDSWLQNGDHVHNPYLGAAMMTCGDVQKKF